jgi:hypothetical protein
MGNSCSNDSISLHKNITDVPVEEKSVEKPVDPVENPYEYGINYYIILLPLIQVLLRKILINVYY